jgi:leucyl aminopeptidase
MVDAVNQPGIESYVTRLSSLDRFTWSQDCFIAGEGIKNAFESWGYTAVREQSYDPGWAPNVIAIKPGTVYPDEYVLIGGHYDSFSFFGPSAPGADDNASGSATVLEAARVMADYEFERSLAFVTFSGEEMGLVGSYAVASFAASRGIDIRAVINVDMDGYVEPGAVGDLDVIANNPSYWIYEIVQTAADNYVPDLETVHQSGFAMGGSDHQSFWDNGYEAVWFFEDVEDYSPYIHSSDDIVGLSYNDPEFATNCTKIAVAALALMADPIE